MKIWKIIGLLGVPFYLCSCQTVEQVKAFVRADTIREYVENHPLDVTLVSEKAGATLERYVDTLKQFLSRYLGLKDVPITYSGKTVVEAEVKPHLQVRAQNFTLSDLPVRELEIHTPSVHLSVSRVFSERNFRFLSQSRFPTWITLDAEGLSTYIQKKQPQFQDFSLKLRANRVELRMTYPFLGIPMPIRVVGRLTVRDKTQIHFVDPEVTVQDRRLPDEAAAAIVNQFNPVFDVSRDLRLPVGLELDEIETKDEVVVLQGRLILEGKIQPGPSP